MPRRLILCLILAIPASAQEITIDPVPQPVIAQRLEAYVSGVGSTDSEPFREAKIPAITIHSLTPKKLSVLHSPKDRIEAVNRDAYYRSYQTVLFYLAVLDQKLDAESR